jgi:hypothetical protein
MAGWIWFPGPIAVTPGGFTCSGGVRTAPSPNAPRFASQYQKDQNT